MITRTDWQKSSYSGTQGDCVELSSANGAIRIRESDDPGVTLAATPAGLAALIRQVKTGEIE
jgi:Domain of unknown function (DUF397)